MMTEDELKAIEARVNVTTPGRWFWNSYSCVQSAPMLQADAVIEQDHEAAGSPWDEKGDYPEPWKSRAKEVDPAVCWVPPHHGDTAIGRHAADADFIAHAREDIPALIAEVRRLNGFVSPCPSGDGVHDWRRYRMPDWDGYECSECLILIDPHA